MPRKREVVKIDDKEYTIKELTVEEIINISSGSVFFSGLLKDDGVGKQDESEKDKKKSDLLDNMDIVTIMSDLNRVMETCCDFKSKDLVKLAPSQIREIYNGFKKVNSDFLSCLKALGVAEAFINIKDAALSRFSKTLATLLKQDM